jgi:c-di-GMP phosphodiesterase
MNLRWPSVTPLAMVVASLVAFATGGHFAAKAVIEGQQSRQLEELTDVALRRSEVAVDFGAATLDELARRGPLSCDPASLQAVRLQVYQRSAVKDIRLVDPDGSVICSAYSETLEFDNGRVDRPEMLPSSDKRLLLFRVDQFSGTALGVLRDLDERNSLVAILGINSHVFDIMAAELRGHSEVLLQLGNGSEVGRFSLKRHGELSQPVSFDNVSHRYPLRETIRLCAPDLAGLPYPQSDKKRPGRPYSFQRIVWDCEAAARRRAGVRRCSYVPDPDYDAAYDAACLESYAEWFPKLLAEALATREAQPWD